MKCKFCGNEDSKVIDSRTNDDSTVVRRRRECTKCGKRFTTLEEYETTPILVVKRDGTRQVFDKEKLKRGIIKACEKRPVNINQIENLKLDPPFLNRFEKHIIDFKMILNDRDIEIEKIQEELNVKKVVFLLKSQN